jgi:hypothetical protein
VSTGYVASLTGTSAVFATAYVDEEIPTPLVAAPKSATAVVQWGAVSVGIAFSNEPTSTAQLPGAIYAYSTVTGGSFVGLNRTPVTATAIVQQSNTPTPPSPAGSQLSFFWG